MKYIRNVLRFFEVLMEQFENTFEEITLKTRDIINFNDVYPEVNEIFCVPLKNRFNGLKDYRQLHREIYSFHDEGTYEAISATNFIVESKLMDDFLQMIYY